MAPKSNGHPSLFLFLLSIMPVLSARLAAAQPPPPPPPPPNSQMGYLGPTNFSPSMAIVIIVLIAAFFFLGFFSIYIRQCSADPTGEASPAVPAPGANMQRGLDPAIIETFPTMIYSEVKTHKAGKGVLECAVCLSEFEDDEMLKLLPKCSHAFHPDCIDAWLAGHATCPVCRSDLMLFSKEEASNQDALTVDHESSAESTTAVNRQEEEIPGDLLELPADAVVVEVETESKEEQNRKEAMELERIRSMRRAMRSKSSWRLTRFPRSHSTGHSLSVAARTGDACERYTLRIPEQVLRQIIAEGKLKRSTSLFAYRETGEGSARPWYRGNGEGSSRSGRSVRMFVRNLSEKFSSWGIGRGSGEGEGSAKGEGSTVRGRFGSVRVQFDCLAGGAGGAVAASKADSAESSVGRRVDRVNAD